MSLLRPATVLVCILVVLAGCGGPGDGGDGGENQTGVDEETTEDLEGENDTGVGEDENDTGVGEDENETGVGEDGNETGIGNETENETGLNETENETGFGNETENETADTGDLDVEQVRNDHVQSLQEAGSATVVIESERPSVQERQVVKMNLDNQTTYRRSKVTTDGDENVTVYYTADGTTYVRHWNESGPADYRVIEGEGADSQNDSAFGDDTETENDTGLGNDTNATENDTALGDETENDTGLGDETENDTGLGNDTETENESMTENDSAMGNESDVGGEAQGEIAEHQKQYVRLEDAFTVIGATNWTEEGEVERNGKNVTLYTASGADKLDESGIPDNLTSDEGATGADTATNDSTTENDTGLGNDTNATENDTTLGDETENDTGLGNDTNATENDSAFGDDTETENESMTENDSAMGNESDVGTATGETNVTDYGAVLVVGPNGTIERFSYELTVENESGTQTVEENYITRDVGETTVSAPGWLDLARERAGTGAAGADTTANESGNMTNESGDLTGNESGNMTANETGNETGA